MSDRDIDLQLDTDLQLIEVEPETTNEDKIRELTHRLNILLERQKRKNAKKEKIA